MSKTVTLRIDEELLERFKAHAKMENRSVSNFIETATLQYIDKIEHTDEFEMSEILNNKPLLKNLKKGSQDAKHKRGRFV